MKFSSIVRVLIISALVLVFATGLVVRHMPEKRRDAQPVSVLKGRAVPKWFLWTAGISLGSVAYISAVFWILFRRKHHPFKDRVLQLSDGLIAFACAPFVVVFSPVIVLASAAVAYANNPSRISEWLRQMRERRARRLAEEKDRCLTETMLNMTREMQNEHLKDQERFFEAEKLLMKKLLEGKVRDAKTLQPDCFSKALSGETGDLDHPQTCAKCFNDQAAGRKEMHAHRQCPGCGSYAYFSGTNSTILCRKCGSSQA